MKVPSGKIIMKKHIEQVLRSIPIKGNERFCALVIAYADKFFGPIYDNK